MLLLRLRDRAPAGGHPTAGSILRTVRTSRRVRDARPVLDPQRVDRYGGLRPAERLRVRDLLRRARPAAGGAVVREATLRSIQRARQLVRSVSEGKTSSTQLEALQYAEAIVDLVGDTCDPDRRPLSVSGAINHASRTFRSFTAADWRAMAQECMRQADRTTCVDCGGDVGINGPPPKPGAREHRLRGDRWSCR